MPVAEAVPASVVLRAFVRNVLGCTCPETVFDAVARTDLAIAGRSAGTRLVLGDRLLIYLVQTQEPIAKIATLADAGLADRDRHGLNRFRLVIGLVDDGTRTALEDAFAAAVAGDAKAHLHCVRGDEIASAL